MPDVLLFGATGYTGSLTAEALARRGTSFAIAGRNLSKLQALAARTGAAEVHVAGVGDVEALTRALTGAKVLITCVGPFEQLGDTAAEAAIRAGVHYLDSTGEMTFIERLVNLYDERARQAGIVMAPAMGFDEVPADVAATLASEDMSDVDLVLTYAALAQASTGTMRTILANIATRDARWIDNGKPITVRSASRSRWAPMPPPLGPKLGIALPFSESVLAPMHLDLRSLEIYGVVSSWQAPAMRITMPLVQRSLKLAPVGSVIDKLLDRRSPGPDPSRRSSSRWTILAEARSGDAWRNVALTGTDVYGLTAETLAGGALKLATEGHEDAGVMSPVQAVGLDALQKELIAFGVDTQIYEPV